MRRAAALALLMAGVPGLSGCIAAAALPVVAAGSIAKARIDARSGAKPQSAPARAPVQDAKPIAPPAANDEPSFDSVEIVKGPLPAPDRTGAARAPAETIPDYTSVEIIDGPMPRPDGAQAVPAPSDASVTPPAGMQFLYGSGEGAALSHQAYRALWSYLSDRASDRKAQLYVRGVVLSPEGTLDSPRFVPCDDKPLAAVFDVDETVLLNLGYEANDAASGAEYDAARWKRWEESGANAVAPAPGAVEAIDAARRAGIAIVFNSNRSLETAPGTIAAIAAAGLGNAELGKTLWLREGGSGKDARRAEIAARYCVVALVGDQLGDFSDLFNPADVAVPVRRNLASGTKIAAMWGYGWFMLPNPVYGSGLKGGLDDVFPRDKRWTDPGEAAKATAPTK